MDVYELSAKLTLDSSEYDKGLSDSESQAKSFGAKLKGGLATAAKVGAAAVAVVSAAAVGAGVALVKQTAAVASYGDNIDKMSQKMGISAEAYQEWDAIMQHSGTSIDSMQRGMITLSKAAENGAEEFQKLGISTEELASLSQEDLFARTIEGLQGMEEGTERTALAQKLLGGSAKELGALLNTSAEETEAMRQRVHELGGVMSDEAVKAAAAYTDALQDMQTSFAGLKRGLISDFMPAITTIMDGITAIFSGDSGGLGKLKEGISAFIKGIQEAAPRFLSAGKSILSALYQAILDNIAQIAEGGTELVIGLITGIISSLPELIPAVVTLVQTVVSTLWEHFPEIIQAGRDAITSLTDGMDPAELITKGGELLTSFIEKIFEYAPQVLQKGVELISSLASGVSNNLPEILSAIAGVIGNVLTSIMNRLPEFLAQGVSFIGQMAAGVLRNLPAILGSIASVIASTISNIGAKAPQFLQKGIELIGKMAAGLIRAIPQVIAAIPQIIQSIKSPFDGFDWASIGKNLITGIGRGIAGAASSLAQAALGAIKGAWDTMTGFLKISSPSKLAEEVIGKNWALGIGIGFEKYMPSMDMVGTVKGTFDDMTGTGGSAGGFMPVINVYGAAGQNIEDLADIVMDRMVTLYNRKRGAYA